MSMPYLGRALKGWTKKSNIKVITKSIVDHEIVETESDDYQQANFQPVPPEKVDRKPEEQRNFKWWKVIVKSSTFIMKIDDIIIDAYGRRFRVDSVDDWRESGFTSYEVHEDYE